MTVRALNDLGYYRALWSSSVELPEWDTRIGQAMRLLVRNQPRYRAVEGTTRVPWVFLGLVHLRESGCDFSRQLLNGQRWTQKTTLVPKGVGPWVSWEDSTVWAMRHFDLDEMVDWSVPNLLYQMEKWNGGGYRRRGKHSPYLWSGTNHGVGVGKYVADGRYNPKAVDQQVGTAPVLKRLIDRLHWVAPQ